MIKKTLEQRSTQPSRREANSSACRLCLLPASLQANLSSADIAQKLFHKFLPEDEDHAMPQRAGGGEPQELSPVGSSGERYGRAEAGPASGQRQQAAAASALPAPSPGSFNPLFFLNGGSSEQEPSATGTAADPAAAAFLAPADNGCAAPHARRSQDLSLAAGRRPRVGTKSERALVAAAGAQRPRLAGGKRKASPGQEAEEGDQPAAKRRAQRKSGAVPGDPLKSESQVLNHCMQSESSS